MRELGEHFQIYDILETVFYFCNFSEEGIGLLMWDGIGLGYKIRAFIRAFITSLLLFRFLSNFSGSVFAIGLGYKDSFHPSFHSKFTLFLVFPLYVQAQSFEPSYYFEKSLCCGRIVLISKREFNYMAKK